MTRVLFERLATVWDGSLAPQTMAARASWTAHPFGARIADVRAIVPHATEGWPWTQKLADFVAKYSAGNGIGPQLGISNDGTAAPVIDLPLITYHATWVNTWALGIEQTNSIAGRRNWSAVASEWFSPGHSARWVQLNQVPGTQANDDAPGARAWLARSDAELACAWWTTATYAGPGDLPIAHSYMLFSEWNYRSLATLCRYLAEEYRVPRSFPLFPYVQRSDTNGDGEWLRRSALADPAFADIVVGINNARAPNFRSTGQPFIEADFQGGATYDAKYAVQTWTASPAFKRQNVTWPAYLRSTRMFFGHAYSGAISAGHGDHDCPGPVFDWYRFAREVWDYWWYPFDTTATGSAPARRAYLAPRKTTPLVEYYFDESEVTRAAAVVTGGVHGAGASPTTFELPYGTPVYAMANGTLVAAQMPVFDAGRASSGFALVCHEIFPHTIRPAPGVAPDTIYYGQNPLYAYSLYTHLGASSATVDFDHIVDTNPDWLNRVLLRLRECDLGTTFYAHPTHHGIADGWDAQPPGAAPRHSLRESWAQDKADWGGFLAALRAGNLALAPLSSDHPITILLGDFLGPAGTVSLSTGGLRREGVRVEVFSTAPLLLPSVLPQAAWSDALPFGSQRYVSEWARAPTLAERINLAANGHDADALRWWRDVVLALQLSRLPPPAWLPLDGAVWHSRPVDVAHWYNKLIWRHERQKYRSPTVAALPQPRSRRV